jgi:endoribonuclease Dicer
MGSYSGSGYRFEVEEVDGGYTCRLLLPPNSRVREASSPTCTSKRAARQVAALVACRRLYEMGALDDHLLPFKPDVEAKELRRKRYAWGGRLHGD